MSKNKIHASSRNGGLLIVKRIFCYTCLILLAFLSLFPFYMLIVNSSRDHDAIQNGFAAMFKFKDFEFLKTLKVNLTNVLNNENMPIVRAILNSILISSLCAMLSTYFSAMTAYAIHVYNFKLKKYAFAFILLIMMVPTQVSALGFIALMDDLGFMNTIIPLVIPSIAAPATFFFMKQYMDSALPLDIVEAARIDGSNEFKTFNSIVLPIMKPAIAVQAIFTFVTSWNNYFMPALILEDKEKKTLPIFIAQLRSADFLKFDMGQVYMLISVAIIPLVIVYLLLSKFIIRGIALGSVKG